MMVKASDDCEIAYSVCGSGPALVLLHGGFVQNRRVWTDLKHVDYFQNDFTVITIDIRGHGDSSKPTSDNAYSVDKLMNDIDEVTQALGFERFFEICATRDALSSD